ncbi:alpha/beta fold hydrolase [Marimonas sp. MJW-29]|uniref:Alpha/beta fold hydrolase n=1 Tax=Sulfitobacter sediminis TaxID=3234186 RepID=A0ABV3RH30_9RHOB
MPSLYLPDREAFVRWDEVGRGDHTAIWLPGLGFPALGNFLSVVTDPAMPPLRSILIDPPGAGRSTFIEDLSVTDHADIVAAVMDHLATGPCAVVGYSMGGAFVAELALRRPDLVDRMILAEGNLLTGGGPGTRHMAAVSAQEFANERLPEILGDLHEGAIAGDTVDDFILASWGQVDPIALHGMARALVALRPEMEDEVLRLALRRSYIFGALNLADPEERIAKNLPDPDRLKAAGFTVLTQEGAGHELMLKDPATFAALIAPLLAP